MSDLTPDDELNRDTIQGIEADIVEAEAALVILSKIAVRPSAFGQAMHGLARELGGWITHHRITLEQWRDIAQS